MLTLVVKGCVFRVRPVFVLPSAMSNYTRSSRNQNATEKKTDFSSEGERIISRIEAKIDGMKQELLAEIHMKDVEIGELKEQVKKLQCEVTSLKNDVDDSEAYERRDTLILSGSDLPAVQVGELTTNVCCDIVKKKLNFNMNTTDISISHRIGKKPSAQGPDRRSLMVKLCRRDIKTTLLSACRDQKPTGFYINESLTVVRSKIMYVLRRMKKEENSRVTGAFSRDGRVFAWIKHAPGSPPGSRNIKVPVNTVAALQEFSTQYMGKDVSNYADVTTF